MSGTSTLASAVCRASRLKDWKTKPIFWFRSWEVGGVIAAALAINLLVAAFAGVVIPFALKRMSIDPALAGSVVLTTVTDVIGFMAFLGLGAIFLT